MSDPFELCDPKVLVKELYERGQRIKKLEDLIRWRKWPEEVPEFSGWYLCNHGRLKGGADMSTVFYEAKNYGWVFEITPKHWRPIGELPKETTEAGGAG